MSANAPSEQAGHEHACCAPARGESKAEGQSAPTVAHDAAAPPPHGGWQALAGGEFLMGCEDSPYPDDGEGPVREVTLSPFEIAATTVTAAEFEAFTGATGFRTDAERYGWSFVFAGYLPRSFPPTRGVQNTPWWRQ